MVPLSSEPEVRIRIKNGVASTKLAGPGEMVIQPRTGKPAVLPGPLTIAATSTGCTVTDSKGKVQTFAGLEPLDIVPMGEGSSDEGLATRMKVDGVSYPGNIRILPRGESVRAGATGGQPATAPKLDVIEMIPMETYLAGVVGAELFKDWPETAFKVQAVCARTYALHERERATSQGRDFDLESTTADQAYNGGAQLPVAVKAVSETQGVVITWQGRLLRAYYSSTCGGRTASAADIWPTGPGYEFNLDQPIQAPPSPIGVRDLAPVPVGSGAGSGGTEQTREGMGQGQRARGCQAGPDQPRFDHRPQRGWKTDRVRDRG